MIEGAKNTMMTDAPDKKEFHFARTATHYALVVYAETIEKAEKLYHQFKKPLSQTVVSEGMETSRPAPQAVEPSPAAPLSTPVLEDEHEAIN